MRSFSRKLWKERALARITKIAASGEGKAIGLKSRNLTAIKSLHVVVKWCEARSIKVKFGRIQGGEYDPIESSIAISGRASPESQLFLLLHEIGHYLFEKHGSSRNKKSRGYAELCPTDKSMHYKVDTIEEEYEAWDRGWKLAQQLKIDVNSERFNACKIRSIRTYFEWAVRKDDGEDGPNK